ncbi:hypothetical protein ZEAMMB73_Zm00001d017035 [Zea mays]|uniref:Uncharacterized protein n=1 Tax=Zea mays TaxID=4577 RepID=A0A1D6HBU1_MAIZE|nr:hypothetical protein ZEAMMB73_Zm00001d017035 [Zea mays]
MAGSVAGLQACSSSSVATGRRIPLFGSSDLVRRGAGGGRVSERAARVHSDAVTFVSTPRNVARLSAISPELSVCLRVVVLDLPPQVEGLLVGAESTVDLPPEKVELLKEAFDDLVASFASFVVESPRACAGPGVPPAWWPRPRSPAPQILSLWMRVCISTGSFGPFINVQTSLIGPVLNYMLLSIY